MLALLYIVGAMVIAAVIVGVLWLVSPILAVLFVLWLLVKEFVRR